MKVAVLGDVGQRVYHAGDEAMAHAAVDELRARGVAELVLLSRDPVQTAALYDTEAIPALQFPWPSIDRERYLGEIRRVLQGDASALPANDQIFAFIDNIRSCDAVLIAGGGNMNSDYGWLLYERTALALVADALGKPLVVSGQTLGPTLIDADKAVLTTMLSSASLVGLREAASFELAKELLPNHLALVQTLDDASFLSSAAAELMPDTPYIAASFTTNTGGLPQEFYYKAIANSIDDVVSGTGMKVLFLPHMDIDEVADQDLAAHLRIAEKMRSHNVVHAPMLPAREVARLTTGARLVLTTRYHPAVFAAAAGIPVAALCVDDYSDVRITGALDNWGLGAFSIPLPQLETGEYANVARVALSSSEILAHALKMWRGKRKSESTLWWDAVVSALEANPTTLPKSLEPIPSVLNEELTPWLARSHAIQRVSGPRDREASQAQGELIRERDLHTLTQHQLKRHSEELSRLRNSRVQRNADRVRRLITKPFAGGQHDR